MRVRLGQTLLKFEKAMVPEISLEVLCTRATIHTVLVCLVVLDSMFQKEGEGEEESVLEAKYIKFL